MPKTPGFPRPNVSTIAAAISGTGPGGAGIGRGFRATGIGMMHFLIDDHGKFYGGAGLNATRIDKLGMSFKSFQPALKASLDEVIIPSIKQNFIEQGRPKWQKLSSRTIKNRLYEGYPRGPILDKTGVLKKAAGRKNNWEIQTHILKFRSIYFSQKVPYAGYHQKGSATRMTGVAGFLNASSAFPEGMWSHASQRPKGVQRMPARPFLRLTDSEVTEIHGIFIAFMLVKVEKYWGSGSDGLGI